MRTRSLPRRRRARPLEPSERRSLLLQCAIKVFARRGLQGASYAEIAREAKVAIPTVFVYFPSRASLMSAVLDEVARFSIDMTRRFHDAPGPAPQVLLDFGHAYLFALKTHPDYLRVMLEWGVALRDEIWPLYLRMQEQLVAMIAETIARWRSATGRDLDKSAEDDARVIVATGPMLLQMSFARVPHEKIEQFLHSVIRDVIGEDPAPGAPHRGDFR
jgi:TetR/AcrR family hemagglutinin/protease transcriptional regulator